MKEKQHTDQVPTEFMRFEERAQILGLEALAFYAELDEIDENRASRTAEAQSTQSQIIEETIDHRLLEDPTS